jgi:hypothetical protein
LVQAANILAAALRHAILRWMVLSMEHVPYTMK